MKRLYSFALLATAAATAAAALAAAGPVETERYYLSGRDRGGAVRWDFMCTAGAQSGYWTRLWVPANWEAHGFGTPAYHKESTNAYLEEGHYQTEFITPGHWAGRTIFLVFEGVMTDTRAEINGQPAGLEHQGGFYRFRYDVTPLVRLGGSNHLSVVVHKRSANESVNRAERQGDYWSFGGIYRPVYLEAAPVTAVDRVAIDARADGTFRMDVITQGVPAGAAGWQVQAQILDPDDRPVGPPFTGAVPGGLTTLRTRTAAPKLWTAETPNLYQVRVTLLQAGRAIHQHTERFGFRTVEVRDSDGIYVNGRRVILQGANRHSFWPDAGRCLDEKVHRQDIALMKEMNFNAVRMSHYPPDSRFLGLCDELGLYVLDELGGWQKSYDTPTAKRLVEQMVTRDVNHPCILFWDNGNEGGWNTDVDGEFARWDPQARRVLHPWATFGGVNTAHYQAWDKLLQSTTGKPAFRGQDDKVVEVNTTAGKVIYMPTEFLHGLYDGGLGAGLEDYWRAIRGAAAPGGGFLWALVDEGFQRRDTGQLDVKGNAAPDGILGPYREKEASFYTIKELWSPIVVRRGAEDRRRLELEVENRYSFTDAAQCRFHWELRRFPSPLRDGAQMELVASGKAEPPAIPPGTTGKLALRLPDEWDQAHVLALEVRDPGGRELWTWTWPLGGLEKFRRQLTQPATTTADGVARLFRTETTYELSAGDGRSGSDRQSGSDLTVVISRETGELLQVRRGDRVLSLANGPRAAAGESTCRQTVGGTVGPDAVVQAQYGGALAAVTVRLQGNGWLHCSYRYRASGPQPYHGVLFDYPEAVVKHKRWLGDGPYRVWKNRLRGVTLNLWENDYNDTLTGWRDWVYPEFKGVFANVHWLELTTAEGRLLVVPRDTGHFVQVLTPSLPPKELRMNTDVSLPAGLGLLQAIPPIGSKFTKPAQTGPQSQLDVATGEYEGSCAFYFR